MAHSKQYWENRMIQLFNSQDKQNAKLNARMKKEYQRVGANIDKEVASYYAKYGTDDVIEYRKMLVSLTSAERDLLYKNMEAFAIKYPQYSDLMPVRESIYQLNRLEGLQLSVRQNMLELGAIEQEEFDKALASAYDRGYLSSMKGLENQQTFFKVDPLIMQQTINAPWIDGKNFSDRIWDNKERLIRTMNNEIRDGLIRGDSYRKMIKVIENRTGIGGSDAKRLLMTEAAFVLNSANAQAFMDAGILEYEITAVMDGRTSPTCRHMDGEVFKFSERVVGFNAPPFHGYCRSTIIPRENTQVLPQVENSISKTNMQDSVGKDNYDEFSNHLNSIQNERVKSLFDRFGDQISFGKLKDTKAYANGSFIQLSQEAFDGRKSNSPLQTVFHEIGHAFDSIGLKKLTGSERVPTGNVIKKKILRRMVEVEETVSHISGLPKYKLKDTINRDIWEYVNGKDLPTFEDLGPKPRKKAEKEEWEEKRSEIFRTSRDNFSKFEKDMIAKYGKGTKAISVLSDIYESTPHCEYSLPFGSGHGKAYYKDVGKAETEFFAHMVGITTTNDESYAVVNEIFPNAVKTWENIVDDMLKASD